MKENRQLSRRQFIDLVVKATTGSVLAATGLDAAVSHFSGNHTPLTPFWEELETGTLLKTKEASQLELSFGVAIFNPVEPISVMDQRLRDILGIKAVNNMVAHDPSAYLSDWDKPRLALLTKILTELPAGFYSSSQGRVSFAIWQSDNQDRRRLGETDTFRATCICDQDNQVWDYLTESTLEDTNPPVIYFVKKDLRVLFPFDRLRARRTIVHELAHQKTLSSDNYVADRNITIDGALTCLGVPAPSDYYSVDPNLVRLFYRHLDVFVVEVDNVEKAQPRESDLFGVSIVPREFIAIAAENYFEGYETFKKAYHGDLDLATIDKLYSYIKDQVFGGREYSNGHWLK